ncbi:MAG: tetratricopeptide repeat protein, partial [Thermoplasmatota archaeon]
MQRHPSKKTEDAHAVFASEVRYFPRIAGLFGWNWWTDRQADRAEAASELYMMVRSHVEAGQFAQASASRASCRRGANRPIFGS